jgi:hypothetical protein
MPDRKRPVPYPEIDLDQVRAYANSRADATSVRQVAREIGVRHTALTKFLSGSEPYAKTRIPICAWYTRVTQAPVRLATRPEEGQVTDPDGHLEALLADLRGEARTEARIRVASALAHAYRRMGMAEPSWLYAER